MRRTRSFLDERRELLAASPADWNGIAGIELDPADATRLFLRMVKPLPGEPGGVPGAVPPLAAGDLTITGGDRITGLRVLSVAAAGPVLTVMVDQQGDFSDYTLAIDPDVPGFDPILREITFSFRVHCDTDSDCEDPPLPPGDPAVEPRLDYLARDYASYRRMILDRMAVTVPDWTERNPADLGVTLVEWLAHLGDGLGYRLDHVGTEYSLETARLRVSAARHARLTGYRMHNGASARVFAQVRLAEGVSAASVDAGDLAFLTRARSVQADRLPLSAAADAVTQGALAFEPLHDLDLHAGNHEIGLHHWGDADAILARGATTGWLRDPGRLVRLAAGDVLVLAQSRDPVTGRAADADPTARQAVRLIAEPRELVDPLEQVDTGGGPEDLPILEIRWHPEDALGFDLCVGRRPEGEPPLAVALGNIVLADHGLTVEAAQPFVQDGPEASPPNIAPDPTDPEAPPAPSAPDERKALAELDRPRPFRPELARRDLTFSVPHDLAAPGPAARMLATDPAEARAAITLISTEEPGAWRAVPDLLGAGPDATVFVAEVEADGRTRLRFGQGFGGAPSLHGRTPVAGDVFAARYRIGTGTAGNVGAGALVTVAAAPAAFSQVAGVTNPLPASGGRARETIAEARRRAPVAFEMQKRAVTLADYEALLAARDDVQRAAARKRWLGSWSAIFLTVDRVGGGPVDDAFRAALLAYLEPFRMMGHDLTVDAPIYVPLTLALHACVSPDAFAEDVAAALEERFSTGLDAAGRRGFFHPDAVTFGAEIHLGRIYEAALAVPGVDDVRVTVFGRDGTTSEQAIEDGVLRFGPREIPVLANDPGRPDRGRLTIETEGGR